VKRRSAELAQLYPEDDYLKQVMNVIDSRANKEMDEADIDST
jgi:hypothetical protein